MSGNHRFLRPGIRLVTPFNCTYLARFTILCNKSIVFRIPRLFITNSRLALPLLCHTSLVINVVLQIAQPQLCTKTLPEKQVQAKSDLSKQIGETTKKCLGVNISGKDVFESIISRPAPPPPAPFVFSSTLAEKKKAPLLKASTVLNKATPQLVTPSSNSTKSTKAPSLGPQRQSSSKLSPPQQKTSTKPSQNKPST